MRAHITELALTVGRRELPGRSDWREWQSRTLRNATPSPEILAEELGRHLVAQRTSGEKMLPPSCGERASLVGWGIDHHRRVGVGQHFGAVPAAEAGEV